MNTGAITITGCQNSRQWTGTLSVMLTSFFRCIPGVHPPVCRVNPGSYKAFTYEADTAITGESMGEHTENTGCPVQTARDNLPACEQDDCINQHPGGYAACRVLRNIGITLAAASAAVLTSQVALPAFIVKIAGYLAVAGSVMGAVSQTAVKNGEA